MNICNFHFPSPPVAAPTADNSRELDELKNMLQSSMEARDRAETEKTVSDCRYTQHVHMCTSLVMETYLALGSLQPRGYSGL